MATKTGTQWERYKALDKSNRELIEGGKRTNTEIEALLDAMQAFKSARLQSVTLTPERHDLFRTCSMRVEECAFDPKQLKFLASCGVRYAGEVCYIVCDVRWHKTGAMLDSIMRSLGLPEGYDPILKGWEAPYWSDPALQAAFITPCIMYFGNYGTTDINSTHCRGESFARQKTWARQCHSRGVHNMATYFIDRYERRGRAPTEMKWFERELRAPEVQHILWAGALLPPVWSPPIDVPECWTAEEAVIAEEVAMYETPKAWVVEIVGKFTSCLFGACVRYPGEVVEERYKYHHLIGRRYGYDTDSGKVQVLNSKTMLYIDGPWFRINGSEENVARAFSTREKADAYVTENQLKNTVIDHNHF